MVKQCLHLIHGTFELFRTLDMTASLAQCVPLRLYLKFEALWLFPPPRQSVLLILGLEGEKRGRGLVAARKEFDVTCCRFVSGAM